MCEFSPSGSIFCEMGVGMKKEKQVEQKKNPCRSQRCQAAFIYFILFFLFIGRMPELLVFIFFSSS